MIKQFDSVISTSGRPVSGAVISLETYPGGVPVTVYVDDGLTPLVGSLLTDERGYWEFYANAGQYNLSVTYKGIVQRKILDISLGDSEALADLASTSSGKGAELVAFLQSGTGAVTRTSLAKMRDQISTADFALAADGTTDDSAKMLQFLTECGTRKKQGRILAGTYKLNSAVIYQSGDVDVVCDPGVVFDCSSVVSGPGFSLGAGDDFTVLPALNVNIAKGDAAMTLASAPSVVTGDLIMLWNDTDFSWDLRRSYYKAGEFVEVESVSGSDVSNAGDFWDNYTTGVNILVRKLTTRTVRWRGGYFIGPAAYTGFQAIQVNNGRNLLIEDVSGIDCIQGFVALRRCYKGSINRISYYEDQASTGLNYAVNLIACYGIQVNEPKGRSERHFVTFTGGSIAASIPNRDCWVDGGEVSGDEYALDMHAANESCGFRNVTAFGGVQIGGRSANVINSKVHGNNTSANSAGTCIRSGELVDANVTVINNELFGVNRSTSSTHGLLGIIEPVFGGHMQIRGNKLRAINTATNTIVLTIGADCTGDITASIGDMSYSNPNNIAALLLLSQSASSTSVFRSIQIDHLNQIAPLITVRSEQTMIDGVQNRNSPDRGMQVSLIAHSAKQVATVRNSNVRLSSRAGIRMVGAGITEDCVMIVENSLAMNAMQGGVGGETTDFRGSVNFEGCKVVIHRGNTVGDDQTVATQTRLYTFSSCESVYDGGHRVFDQAATIFPRRVTVTGYARGTEFYGFTTFDPPSLAAATGSTTTFAMTGIVPGDLLQASFSLDTQGIALNAWCNTAGTASVRFQNGTGGGIDLASGTLTVRAVKS